MATFKEIREACAKSLGLYLEVTTNTNTVNAHTILTCPDLEDKVVDNEYLRSAYVWRSESEWRRVESTDVPNATITVTRGFATQVAANSVMKVYRLLSPDEWKTAADDGLRDKFFKDRITVPLVDGQREYTPNAAWLKTEGQIVRMLFRDVNDGSTKPVESAVAAVRVSEVDHVVKVILPTQPNITNVSLIIEARHYFDAATNDNTTYSLPNKLSEAAVKREALRQIFHKLGPAAKKVFGQQMVLTEQDLAAAEARWLDTTVRRDLFDEDVPLGGDPGASAGWSW